MKTDFETAFPVYDGVLVYEGMTLRDWFASTASERDVEAHMHYYLGSSHFTRTREKARYHYADAMLKAREADDE
jgi:hypothetical protein